MLKKIRLRTVFVFLLAGLSGALLLHTSQSVQQTEAQLNEIAAAVTREEDSIRLLKTEWAYLNNPARLEVLAKQYLKLQATDPAAIQTDGTAIPAKPLPIEDDVMEAQPVSFSPPVPSVKPAPPSAKPPKEENFNQLLNNVAGGKE